VSNPAEPEKPLSTVTPDGVLGGPGLHPVSESADVPELSQARLSDGIRAVARAMADMVEAVRPAAEWLYRNKDAIALGLAKFAQWVVAMPEATRTVLKAMAADGWFIENSMGAALPFAYYAHMEAGETEEALALMRHHFSSHRPAILEDLCTASPHRAALLLAAFAAVERGEHALAIPVLFAQVDGVCFDAIKGSAFFLRGKRKEVALHLEEGGSDVAAKLANAFLAPFGEDLPVLQSKRLPGFSKLNRHQVLHGESVDYGTEDNSLRAISLLAYVSQRLREKAKV
jgi:hypothetical protein